LQGSSATFETVLTPDPVLRRTLRLLALAALPAGMALILLLPLAPWLSAAACMAWLASGVRDYRALCRGASRIGCLALDALDNLEGIAPDGRGQRLDLLPGSLVLPRLAYLRVRFPDGACYGELLRPRGAADPDWQRLKLLWRLRRLAFGAPDGS